MIAIKNGKIVTPDEVLEGLIMLLDQDRIYGFYENLDDVDGIEQVVNAHDRYIIPGMIDVHSDRFEQYIQPRPTSQMDFEFALKVFERDLLSAGITTMYHSIALYKDEFFGKSSLRTKENVQKIADLIANLQLRNRLIHHRFHLRIEIDNLEALDIARGLIEQEKVHLISFTDHTPGQGQYSSLAMYHDAISKYNGKEISELGFDGVLEHHKNKQVLSLDDLIELASLADKKGIPIASHDDDSEQKLTLNKKIGVVISEFPITLETAKAAKRHGYYTVVGAANILRGCSHSGNMSAAEAVLEDCADILCSDYYPAAILHSIFFMHLNKDVTLPRMVNKATLNPAKALRIDKNYGSLEIGKKADILIVEVMDGYPVITHAFINGNATSRIEYRR